MRGLLGDGGGVVAAHEERWQPQKPPKQTNQFSPSCRSTDALEGGT